MGLKHAASGPHVAHECILFGLPIPLGNFQINNIPVIFSAVFESSLPSSERVPFKRMLGCLQMICQYLTISFAENMM